MVERYNTDRPKVDPKLEEQIEKLLIKYGKKGSFHSFVTISRRGFKQESQLEALECYFKSTMKEELEDLIYKLDVEDFSKEYNIDPKKFKDFLRVAKQRHPELKDSMDKFDLVALHFQEMKQREIDQANFVKAKEDLLKEFDREGQNFSKILPNARRVGYNTGDDLVDVRNYLTAIDDGTCPTFTFKHKTKEEYAKAKKGDKELELAKQAAWDSTTQLCYFNN